MLIYLQIFLNFLRPFFCLYFIKLLQSFIKWGRCRVAASADILLLLFSYVMYLVYVSSCILQHYICIIMRDWFYLMCQAVPLVVHGSRLLLICFPGRLLLWQRSVSSRLVFGTDVCRWYAVLLSLTQEGRSGTYTLCKLSKYIYIYIHVDTCELKSIEAIDRAL